jgi:hypothetical protein
MVTQEQQVVLLVVQPKPNKKAVGARIEGNDAMLLVNTRQTFSAESIAEKAHGLVSNVGREHFSGNGSTVFAKLGREFCFELSEKS